MLKFSLIVATLTVTIILLGGLFVLTPVVFSGRIAPGVQAGLHNLTGMSTDDLPAIINTLEEDIARQSVTLTLRDQSRTYQLAQLGVTLDHEATRQVIEQNNFLTSIVNQPTIQPVPLIDTAILSQQVNTDFSALINIPQNATLQFNATDELALVPSRPGETIQTDTLQAALQEVVITSAWSTSIPLTLQTSDASVQDEETQSALIFARQILADGIDLTFADKTFPMKPFTIKRLLEFTPQVDPSNFNNQILGLKMNPAGLADYLTTTIVPDIDQSAQNARFVLRDDGRVDQFALPQSGRQLDLTATATNIAAKLAKHDRVIPLAVVVTEPAISEQADIQQLGITAKLATGESDFAGSPNNRKHNIVLGASRYHGLLIPPGAEFSFNEFIGPVNAATGFKPELVIKENVTTPEFGGGLCQVSTTLFRSALYSGLEITQRRNHSYAVSYYGKPGLDATIYPPYTDLRFLNNTPGYILIQSRIEGTKLAFDFWGTEDNRSVTVTGPVTYERGSDGSVKAYVSQEVALADKTIINQTFYSRYKSPKLFPRVLAANGEAPPSTVPPVTDPQASPSVTVLPTPVAVQPSLSPAATPVKKSPIPTNESNSTTNPADTSTGG